jgi:antitoxin (DNA-binding transcriptional repressor) of toxin-antitoxin stability system
MKEKIISVTEAARNFADCVNRAYYQDVTFILERNGAAVARLVPGGEKTCLGSDLAEILRKIELEPKEAAAWHRDLRRARKSLKPLTNRWQ